MCMLSDPGCASIAHYEARDMTERSLTLEATVILYIVI